MFYSTIVFLWWFPWQGIKDTQQYQELEDMMWHACFREYYDEAYAPYWESKDAKSAAIALLDAAMVRIAKMVLTN